MVFTQSRGFVLGASFGLQCRSLRCRVLVRNAADTASLAARFLFGKLIGVATLVGFGEKRCRGITSHSPLILFLLASPPITRVRKAGTQS